MLKCSPRGEEGEPEWWGDIKIRRQTSKIDCHIKYLTYHMKLLIADVKFWCERCVTPMSVFPHSFSYRNSWKRHYQMKLSSKLGNLWKFVEEKSWFMPILGTFKAFRSLITKNCPQDDCRVFGKLTLSWVKVLMERFCTKMLKGKKACRCKGRFCLLCLQFLLLYIQLPTAMEQVYFCHFHTIPKVKSFGVYFAHIIVLDI